MSGVISVVFVESVVSFDSQKHIKRQKRSQRIFNVTQFQAKIQADVTIFINPR